MARIFISYRRADSADVAGRMYDRLAAAFGPENVFKDVDSIPLGSDFTRVIAEQMSKCQVAIVVIGKSWVKVCNEKGGRRLDDPADFVRIEVVQALGSRILVVPVLVGHAAMPSDSELPVSLRPLTRRNALLVRPDPDFHRDIDRLVKSLQDHFQIKPSAIQPRAPAAPRASPSKAIVQPPPITKKPVASVPQSFPVSDPKSNRAEVSSRFIANRRLRLVGLLGIALGIVGAMSYGAFKFFSKHPQQDGTSDVSLEVKANNERGDRTSKTFHAKEAPQLKTGTSDKEPLTKDPLTKLPLTKDPSPKDDTPAGVIPEVAPVPRTEPSPTAKDDGLLPGEKVVEFEYVINDTERKVGKCRVLTLDIGGGESMEFIRIKAGTFLMGASEGEKEANEDEKPERKVEITKDFYLGKFEVTQAQYKEIMGESENKSEFRGDRLPVERVSWADAVTFCEKLSERVRSPTMLPSEAQWEYACRAGTVSPFHFGSKLNGNLANCDGTNPYGASTIGISKKRTTEVGSYPANPWGLHDMHGNVWEWCRDCFGRYDKVEGFKDPLQLVKQDNDSRVVRGGSFRSYAGSCRAAYRDPLTINERIVGIGFRVCLALD